jgi:hypothetical protein
MFLGRGMGDDCEVARDAVGVNPDEVVVFNIIFELRF